ncbi:SAG family member [Eimeria mitis]|uniref:SAG family member n=1 Tax=Eimeria mitis TaxID=44415 RepID=U6JXH9_9EIME|nr:SAG family member [Eimeria mitis]CDJ30190.1 SAG family member [Eimeria mitis]
MAALKLFSLANASAFLMANAVHQTAKQASLTAQGSSPTYTVELDDANSCLAEMNAAREAAGLKHFVTDASDEQLTWPPLTLEQGEDQKNPAWDPVCKALIGEDSADVGKSVVENGFKSGTYAYMALESDKPDCAAAVSHWKDAVNSRHSSLLLLHIFNFDTENMAALKLFSLASASAFLMANAVHQTAKQISLTAEGSSPTYTVELKDANVCLTEMNAAREAAGLEHFKTETSDGKLTWPSLTVQPKQEEKNPAWDPVCKALMGEDTEQLETGSDENGFQSGTYAFMALESATPDCAAAEESAGVEKSVAENGFKSGTYAYMALESETPDCAAAVSHWKDAVSNFTTIPPANKEETKIYSKQQNISFVALYNPQENAAADCRVVTCTRSAAPQAPGVGALSTGDYALLCMTTPEALTADAEPFNEDQWKKIKASITGSASAVAPSLLAVAIAAVGLLTL